MRLLYDQNLSPRLPRKLARIFPDSIHVRDVELQRADDSDVWQYAREHGFTIVTTDSDFRQLSFLNGHPPNLLPQFAKRCLLESTRDQPLELFVVS